MADQQVNFVLKATNQASAEFARVAADMTRLNHQAVTANAGVAQWGNAWGTASKTVAAGAKDAAGGLDAFGAAAKGVASGGVQQLLSSIPGVGGALANLAGALGPTTLLLGGFAAAGYGVLKMLQGFGKEADAALAKVTALAEGVGNATRQTRLEVEKIRAESRGDQEGALAADQAAQLAAIEATKKARIDAANAELTSLNLLGQRRTELSQAGRNEILAAEAEAQLKKFKLREQGNAALKTLDDKRLADEKENREKAVKAEAEAVEKQKALVKDLTASSLATFRELGAGFEDVVKTLELAQFVEKTTAEIAKLNAAIDQGLDTHGRFAAGIDALTRKQQEAIALGYVPTVEAAKKVTEAVTVTAVATEKASESIAAGLFRMGAASAEVIERLDALIAKGRAIQAQGAGGASAAAIIRGAGGAGAGGASAGAAAGGGRYGMGGSMGGADWSRYNTMLGPILNAPKGSGLTPFNPANDPQLQSWDKSYNFDRNVNPNPNPASNAGYRPQPTVQQVNLTVNQTGTVIQQDRDWATLTESVAAAIQAGQ